MTTHHVTCIEAQQFVAAIDLGSNSFHMIVARLDHNEIRPVERLGEKVQLAAGIDEQGLLTNDAMERGLACLRKFAEYIDGMAPENIRIVGTNALRKARNSDTFIRFAEQELGHPVDIIAGREEARLIYLGVAHTYSDDNDRRLVIDIGGGSTELIIGQRFEPRLLESLHMGCVGYTRRFFPNGGLSEKRFMEAYYSACLELMNIEQDYRNEGWAEAIGSSGSIKSVHDILAGRGIGRITRDGLQQIKRDVLQFRKLAKVHCQGLKPERAAIFPAGLAILIAVFDRLNIDGMDYSDGALREGVLYDLVGRQSHEDVRERTINAMMTRYHVDGEQARRVSKYATLLFQQVADGWKLDEQDLRLLQNAALLHEIGLDISHIQFHRHGAYIIRNSDLFGFSSRERQQLAMLVRGHRRTLPLRLLYQLPRTEFTRLLRLMILLRLAILLNLIRTDRLTDVELQVKNCRMTLKFPDGWLDQHLLTKTNIKYEREYLQRAGYRLKYL